MSGSPVDTPVAEHNPEPSKDFIYGAAPPAIGAALLIAFGAGWIDGGWAAVSAVIGGVLSSVALAVGPLVMHWARDARPMGVLVRALLSYVVVIVALGVAYVLLDDVERIDGTWVGIGVLASAVAWLGGQYRTLKRLRLPVFEPGVPFDDDPHEIDDEDDDGVDDGAGGDTAPDATADRDAGLRNGARDDLDEGSRQPSGARPGTDSPGSPAGGAEGGRTDGPDRTGEGSSGNTG